MPCLAEIAKPMYELLHSTKKFQWTPECQAAFEKLKKLLAERLVLSPIRKNGTFSLYTDASDVACGAVLLQDGRPVEYFSKVFTPTQQRYSTHERETFGLVCALRHSRKILQGREFKAFTDHKPLVHWWSNEVISERGLSELQRPH